MQKIKACAIIFNKAGELLLQLRDEEPETGKWVLFGGGVKEGEAVEAALAREIKEELGYDIKSARFLGEYENNNIRQLIFVLEEPIELQELKLGEGSAMKFFTAESLANLEIGFNFKEILNDNIELVKILKVEQEPNFCGDLDELEKKFR